jgi:hypothetical protein
MTSLARHNALNKRSLPASTPPPSAWTLGQPGDPGAAAVPAYTSIVTAIVCAFRSPPGPPTWAPQQGNGSGAGQTTYVPPAGVTTYSCLPETQTVYHAAVPARPPIPAAAGTYVTTGVAQSTADANNLGWADTAASIASLLTGAFSFAYDARPFGIVAGLSDWDVTLSAKPNPNNVTWGFLVEQNGVSIWESGNIVYVLPATSIVAGMRLGIEFIDDLPRYWFAASGDEFPRTYFWHSTVHRRGPWRALYAHAYLYAVTDHLHTPLLTPYAAIYSSLFDYAASYVQNSAGRMDLPVLFVNGGNNAVNTMMPLQAFTLIGGRASSLGNMALQPFTSDGGDLIDSSGYTPPYAEANMALVPFQLYSSARTAQGGGGTMALQNFSAFGGRLGQGTASMTLVNFDAIGGGVNTADEITTPGAMSPGGTVLTGITRIATAGEVLIAEDEAQGDTFILVFMDSAGLVVSVAAVNTVLDAAMLSTGTLTAPLDANALLIAVMNSLIGSTSIDTQAQAAGQVWVVNVETGASVRYDNFNFNSYARIGGTYYGARSDGIYELDGDTDAGTSITANLNMGRVDFNSKMLKRLDAAYMTVGSYDTMVLRVTDDEGNVYDYAARRSGTAMQQQRIDVGRGLKANYMQFEIVNLNGADFELGGLELMAADSTRRIK